MKKFKMLGLALVALMASAFVMDVRAAVSPPDASKSFSVQGTAIGATNAYCIVSANGSGAPRLEYLSATSDKAGSKVLFYASAAGVSVTLATNASQAVCWAVGTTFAANDKVVLRHVATDTYERLVVSSSTSTNITFTGNLASAVVAGDILYDQSSTAAQFVGNVPVGNATKEVVSHGGGVFNGIEGRPLYFEIDSTSAGSINLASGVYSLFVQARR